MYILCIYMYICMYVCIYISRICLKMASKHFYNNNINVIGYLFIFKTLVLY